MSVYNQFLIFIAIGAIAGFLSGSIGVGGGIIVVPSYLGLFTAQGFSSTISMHLAVGTSLAAMIFTASFALYAHIRHGAKFKKILYFMSPGLIVGTIAGSLITYSSHSKVLQTLFGVLLVSIALYSWVRDKMSKHREVVLEKPLNVRQLLIGSSMIGLFSGFFGLGGGSITVPFLEYLGLDMKKAVSISVACGLVVALTGAAVAVLTGVHNLELPRGTLGYVYIPAFVGVALSSPIFAFVGTRFHQRTKVQILRYSFYFFLFLLGLYLISSSLLNLTIR